MPSTQRLGSHCALVAATSYRGAIREDSKYFVKYQYGEIFKRLGIPGMGHQGTTWCALDPEGTLVLMAHLNYFRRKEGRYQYEHPADEPTRLQAPSHKRSLEMMGSYFMEDRRIILLVAVFITDGDLRPDGTGNPAKFDYATGDYYVARMKQFEKETGYLLCDCDEKRTV